MQNKLFQNFEFVFVILSLIHFSQGLIPLFLTGGFSEGDAGTANTDFALMTLITYTIYLVTFCLVLLRWKKVLAVLLKDRYICILIGLVALSVFWSEVPAKTLNAVITSIGATGFGVYLATRFTIKEHLKILFWMYVAILMLSFSIALVLPKYGFMGGIHAGSLRGIYVHKNIFGQAMIPGAIIFFLHALNSKRSQWIAWLPFVLCLVSIVLCRSTTAIGNLALVLFLLFVYRAFRWRYELLVTTALTGITVGLGLIIWLTNNLDQVFSLVGKEPTLTGRTDIWRFVWEMIEKRPWLGYGLDGFWDGLNGPSAHVERGVRTSVIYSHNGFLDLWVTVGIVGLSIFLVGFVFNTIKALVWIRQSKTPEGIWPLIYLSYMLLSNATESPILYFSNFFWILYVTVIFSMQLPMERQLEMQQIQIN